MKKTYIKPEITINPEIWKVYYESTSRRYGHRVYEVSTHGRVRLNKEILKLYNYRNTEYYADPARVECTLHKLVAKLFIPNPENKPCIDHINGNKHNNNVTNLRWVTQKENINNKITLKRMSEAKIGKKYDDEYKKKMSIICKSIKHTEEWNKNMGKSKKGYIWVNNGSINIQARDYNINEYLNNGWIKGLLKKNQRIIHDTL